MALSRNWAEGKTIYETYLFTDGTDTSSLTYENHSDFLRWFRYPAALKKGRILAIEEWINAKSGEEHARKIAVFDLVTGNEIKSSFVDALTTFPNMDELEKHIRHEIPADGLSPKEEMNPATLDWEDLVEISRSRNLYE
jgi:hypothetical protein